MNKIKHKMLNCYFPSIIVGQIIASGQAFTYPTPDKNKPNNKNANSEKKQKKNCWIYFIEKFPV